MNENIEKIIMENEKLIYWGYKNYTENCDPKHREEIFSIANYSLFKAAKAFNPDRAKFSTLYAKVLYNEIQYYYRKERTKRRYCELGDDLSMNEIINGTDNLRIESIIYNSNKEYNPLISIISDENVREIIKNLKPDELKIVMLKYYNPDITQQQIGEILGVRQVQISRKLKKIRIKISAIMKKGN